MKSLITLEKALEKIKGLKKEYYFRRESERVYLKDSTGRELSETVSANSMSPEFDISAMDGFAINCDDGYPLRISGRVYAGDRVSKIKRGGAVAIIRENLVYCKACTGEAYYTLLEGSKSRIIGQ